MDSGPRTLDQGLFRMSPASTPAPVTVPDARGRFGPYGGRFVPETLLFALDQLDRAYRETEADPAIGAEFRRLMHDYVGRPSRLYYAARPTNKAGGGRTYRTRADPNTPG